MSVSKYIFDASATSFLDSDFDLNGLDNQTVLVRAKLTSHVGGSKSFVGCTVSTGRFYYQYLPTDRLQVLLQDGTDSKLLTDAANWDEDTDWHQFAFNYDGTNISVYVDGVLIETVVDSDFVGYTVERLVQIGMSNGDVTRGFVGEISDYQHYNKALSLAELQSLNTDITDTATGLVANFAENKTSTVWTDEVAGYEAINEGGVVLETAESNYQAILDKAIIEGYTTPSAGQQLLHIQLISDFISNGIWDEEDVIYITANDGSKEFATLNWKDPLNYQLLLGSGVTWSSVLGFIGDGTANGYIDTQYQPYINGVNHDFLDNSFTMYVTQEGNTTRDGSGMLWGNAQYTASRGVTSVQIVNNDDDLNWSASSGIDGTTDVDKRFLNEYVNTDGYLGLLSVARDDSDPTNDSWFFKNGIVVDQYDLTLGTEVTGADYTTYLLANHYNGDVPIVPIAIAFSYFSIGSSMLNLQDEKSTIVSNYMTDITSSPDVEIIPTVINTAVALLTAVATGESGSTDTEVTAAVINTVVALISPTISTVQNTEVTPGLINVVSAIIAPTIIAVQNTEVTPGVINTSISIPLATVSSAGNTQVNASTINADTAVLDVTVITTGSVTISPVVLDTVVQVMVPQILAQRNAEIQAVLIDIGITLLDPTVVIITDEDFVKIYVDLQLVKTIQITSMELVKTIKSQNL